MMRELKGSCLLQHRSVQTRDRCLDSIFHYSHILELFQNVSQVDWMSCFILAHYLSFRNEGSLLLLVAIMFFIVNVRLKRTSVRLDYFCAFHARFLLLVVF